tara:strand:- start:1170 stop:1538 length:369 start_codon:yes stop_codon:yes gene_type:complete
MDKRKKIFKKVSKHLLTQNERSTSEDDCYYRHPLVDLKCAVGCLIDDDSYSVSLEGQQAFEDSVQRAVSDSMGFPLKYEETRLLMDLQNVHDYYPPRDWAKELDFLADIWFNETLEELGALA